MGETTTKTATFVTRLDGNGEGRIYRLEPPIQGHGFVWVSAVDVPYSGPETYIFGCNEAGEIADWCELEGSYRGGLDHAEALRNAGYAVTP